MSEELRFERSLRRTKTAVAWFGCAALSVVAYGLLGYVRFAGDIAHRVCARSAASAFLFWGLLACAALSGLLFAALRGRAHRWWATLLLSSTMSVFVFLADAIVLVLLQGQMGCFRNWG